MRWPRRRGRGPSRRRGAGALRVTFVVPDLGVGGAERHVVDLLAGLDRQRVDPRVVCLGQEGRLYAEAAHHAPATAYGHRKAQAARSILALARELRRSRADVVVTRGYSAELVGRVAAVLARVPHRVVWVHNCDDTEPRGRVRRVADRLLEPVTGAYYGVAHRQVPYLVDDLGHPPAKVRVIHNGVDPARFAPDATADARRRVRAELGIADDEVAVGILAALRPEKDHGLFLAAAARVGAEAPGARFVVVGDGVRRTALEEEARASGLGERVVFTGFRDDVPQVLAALDVVVLSSFSVECLPISLLEAGASGLPVVATDVGGVGEILEEGRTGFLVPSREVGPLAGRIGELVADPALRRSMGRAARERVLERFTLARMLRETEQALTELTRAAGPTVPQPPVRQPPVRQPPVRQPPVRLTVVMDTTAVGGAELVTLRMFEAMDRSLVEPRLVCLRDEGTLAADFRAAGVPVTALHRRGRADPLTLPRLVRELRRRRTDAVLVAHHHRASLALGRVAAALAGVRTTLVAPHDMDLVALGGRVLPTWTVATLRWASALVLLAESQRRYLHDQEGVGRRPWSRTREVVVPNGIVVPPSPGPGDRVAARTALGLPADAFVVGIVARLSTQKAHQVLLRAFARLSATHATARLVVVGGGERETELREMAAELGIAAHTRFTGVRRDVATLLPAFDVSCLSSIHEAAPLSVIEAMAARIPVIVSDCGALREMVSDGTEGIIVPVDDVDALARALDRLATDPVRRTTMGGAARRRVEADFDVAITARGYTEVLRTLTVGSRRLSRGAT